MAIPAPARSDELGESERSDHVLPPLYTADVLACQFSSWYPRFKRVAPKATVIRPLPEDEHLIDFLEADGLFLPDGSGPMGISELSDNSDTDAGEEDDDDDDDDDDDGLRPTFSFPRLDAEIRSAIAKYDGAVFPKLNWSSPQDAAWMVAGQTMKCQTPADVYLLLKSSDFISHDLDHAFADCVDAQPQPQPPTLSLDGISTSVERVTDDVAALDLGTEEPPSARRGGEAEEVPARRTSSSYAAETAPARTTTRTRPYEFELVLKKWFDMPKSQEWRCFVRQDRLLGISQRDSTLYDFFQPERARTEIRDLISDFWERSVRDEAPLSNYVLDVYITRDQSRVFVIDFNPFAPRTDPLLFSYPELHDLFLASSVSPSAPSAPSLLETATTTASTSTPLTPRGEEQQREEEEEERGPPRSPLVLPELRVVTPSSNPAAQSAAPRFAHNRYPKDVVDLSEGQSVAQFAKEWMARVGEAAGLGGQQGDGGDDGGDSRAVSEAALASSEKERVGR
ncbi:hypothetical protein JCM3774_001678 [Rhodotorula dairenensis]